MWLWSLSLKVVWRQNPFFDWVDGACPHYGGYFALIMSTHLNVELIKRIPSWQYVNWCLTISEYPRLAKLTQRINPHNTFLNFSLVLISIQIAPYTQRGSHWPARKLLLLLYSTFFLSVLTFPSSTAFPLFVPNWLVITSTTVSLPCSVSSLLACLP